MVLCDTSGLLLGDDVVRYISTNNYEKEFLKYCRIECKVLCMPGKVVLGISYDERSFIVLPMSPKSEEPITNGVIRRLEDNAGLLTYLWGECEYPFKETEDLSYSLAEKVFGTDGAYDLMTIKPFFMECDIWEIDPGYLELTRDTCFRIYGTALTLDCSQLSLPYSNELLLKIRLMLENSMAKSIGEIIFRALTSTHWEHAFLEFYRCIEMLYSVPYCNELCASLDLELGELDLAGKLENALGWYPREIDALEKILDVVKTNNHDLIDSISIAISTSDIQVVNSTQSVAKAIYKLRNGIAHGRKNILVQDSKLDWNLLLSVLSDLIMQLNKCFPNVYET